MRIVNHLRSHFVAYLALFFSLGGTSFAAVQALPRNSVGSPQIKNGSIQRVDISRRTVSALRGQRGRRGLQGAAGPQGIQGQKGDNGVKGDKGDKGDPGPLVDTLPPGRTLRGAWVTSGEATAQGDVAENEISFQLPLSADPTVHIIPQDGTPPAGCSGTIDNPNAAPGNLCIFVGWNINSLIPGSIQDTYRPDHDGAAGATKFGTIVYLWANGPGLMEAAGTYAVTAPLSASAADAAPASSHGGAGTR